MNISRDVTPPSCHSAPGSPPQGNRTFFQRTKSASGPIKLNRSISKKENFKLINNLSNTSLSSSGSPPLKKATWKPGISTSASSKFSIQSSRSASRSLLSGSSRSDQEDSREEMPATISLLDLRYPFLSRASREIALFHSIHKQFLPLREFVTSPQLMGVLGFPEGTLPPFGKSLILEKALEAYRQDKADSEARAKLLMQSLKNAEKKCAAAFFQTMTSWEQSICKGTANQEEELLFRIEDAAPPSIKKVQEVDSVLKHFLLNHEKSIQMQERLFLNAKAEYEEDRKHLLSGLIEGLKHMKGKFVAESTPAAETHQLLEDLQLILKGDLDRDIPFGSIELCLKGYAQSKTEVKTIRSASAITGSATIPKLTDHTSSLNASNPITPPPLRKSPSLPTHLSNKLSKSSPETLSPGEKKALVPLSFDMRTKGREQRVSILRRVLASRSLTLKKEGPDKVFLRSGDLDGPSFLLILNLVEQEIDPLVSDDRYREMRKLLNGLLMQTFAHPAFKKLILQIPELYEAYLTTHLKVALGSLEQSLKSLALHGKSLFELIQKKSIPEDALIKISGKKCSLKESLEALLQIPQEIQEVDALFAHPLETYRKKTKTMRMECYQISLKLNALLAPHISLDPLRKEFPEISKQHRKSMDFLLCLLNEKILPVEELAGKIAAHPPENGSEIQSLMERYTLLHKKNTPLNNPDRTPGIGEMIKLFYSEFLKLENHMGFMRLVLIELLQLFDTSSVRKIWLNASDTPGGSPRRNQLIDLITHPWIRLDKVIEFFDRCP